MIHTGDCLDVMATLDPESVDAVVTDPPYGLGFMGKHWDHGVPAVEFWQAMLRVAKPSAYLLAFGGTRTVHRMTCAIEDAGWVIRDVLVWAYASGFPKSRASLKPAWEPIVMARKPGPLRDLAIDACRIPAEPWTRADGESGAGFRAGKGMGVAGWGDNTQQFGERSSGQGRWPANVILTDPIFDGGWEGVVGGGEARSSGEYEALIRGRRDGPASIPLDNGPQYGDSGTYSRFFLVTKADRADREPVMGGLATKPREARYGSVQDARPHTPDGHVYPRGARANHHPTVKPTELMRHLVRLVIPSGGVVLDPFLGSGTTALAAEMEGFGWVGIEREPEYVAIAEARLNGTQRGLGLVG